MAPSLDVDLTVHLGPLVLAHPLINASGTLDLFETADSLGAGRGERLLQHPPVAAYVPKTVTLDPRRGNSPPRVVETPAGMLNSIGLPNAGIEAFINRDLDRILALPRPIIFNLGGFSPEEFALGAERLRLALERRLGSPQAVWGKAGLELNVSCPNVHSGCMQIGASPDETEATVRGVAAVWQGLLAVKLTPNVTDAVPVAQAAVEAGATAISLVNTFKGLVLDRLTLNPYLGGTTGGLSGPAIKPLALRFCWEVAAAVEVPIIGMGGVASVEDVIDYLAVGASAVAVGASAFRDPWLYARLARELGSELAHRGLTLDELTGCAHRGGALGL